MNPKTGILLINLGTPDAPTPEAVNRYLAEFLGDPWVVDYPRWLWKPILNNIILRTRPARSARLYASIWGEAGSPLLTITQSIADKLNKRNSDLLTVVGMRYGNPPVREALETLKQEGIRDLIVVPLFPQYSSSTTVSTIEHVRRELEKGFHFQKVTILEEYHDHRAYIQALATSIQQSWQQIGKPDKLLFSFHSIPKRYVTRKGEPYQDHCYVTAALTAQQLGLAPHEYLITFQSKFGPEPWLSPSTSDVLIELGKAKTSSLHVVCPGFAADCLETLEEIAIEGKHEFQSAGGGQFDYIPALNDSVLHVQALGEIIRAASKQ
ncbi:MAG: ferrochelatase [Anaerolineales bacterium]|nr:ferrochelatase [Anaerolineales bacterium]